MLYTKSLTESSIVSDVVSSQRVFLRTYSEPFTLISVFSKTPAHNLYDSLTLLDAFSAVTFLTPPYTLTNTPYANRIQLNLGGLYAGPLQSSTLGGLNPTRDIEVYIDGDLSVVQYSSFDPANNRYLMFMPIQFIPGVQVVQVIHHMPAAPFADIFNKPFSGFAQLAQNSLAGDPIMPTITLVTHPPLTSTTQIPLYWNAVSVPQILVTSSTGYSSGLVSGAGVAGIFYLPAVASGSYTATISGFDALGNAIIVGGNPLSQTISFTVS